MNWLLNFLIKVYNKKEEFLQQSDSLFYKKDCYFYRVKNEKTICVANRSICLLCPLKIKKVDNLDTKDHLNLAIGQIRSDRAYLISIVAITISIFSFILKNA